LFVVTHSTNSVESSLSWAYVRVAYLLVASASMHLVARWGMGRVVHHVDACLGKRQGVEPSCGTEEVEEVLDVDVKPAEQDLQQVATRRSH